ncbi:MAG: S-layer homology domain-containing protein, partial [Lachnospiraceae bacterium]|nr:S-layer homology domain-containing protein [Lachnospiraceae bacterium]
ASAELAKADALGLIPESLVDADLTQSITRAEFAAISVKAYEALSGTVALPNTVNPFTDTSNIEVLKAYNLGITTGVSATTFEPNTLLNREQAATMLTRMPMEIQIVERDSAGYVIRVQVGQKTYTGEEVQYALGLPSSCYTFEEVNGKIQAVCKGVGHGYGFAQFGANEMAKEGKTYRELLNYYFQNVEIVRRL